MTVGFIREVDGIYRLRVPFENLYTSVFLVEFNGGALLVDCATTARDVDEVILPALRMQGYEMSDLSAIVLTHRHGDHAGGLEEIMKHAPNISVVSEAGALNEYIAVCRLAGHTEDSVGVYDSRTKTLISGDGLQGAGVDKYRCSLKNRQAYIETINRIKKDGSIENILLSHAYEPWYADRMVGREAVENCLSDCLKYV